MKNWMKYLSAGMLSLLLVVSAVAGCSNESLDGDDTSAATATGAVEETSAEDSAEDSTEDSADVPTHDASATTPDGSDEVSVPVTDAPTTEETVPDEIPSGTPSGEDTSEAPVTDPDSSATGESETDAPGTGESETATPETVVPETVAPETDAPETDPAEETTAPLPDTIKLTFEGTNLSGSPEGAVVVEDNAFAIVRAGTYELTGNLTGQLRVRVEKTERVTLIFNNFTAYSSVNAPIYLVSADKVIIQLAEGSVNRLTDAKTYQFSDPAETKPNACLYAGCDLKIKGKGTLIVEGNYNNGIGCKKDLEITNGTIQVSAPNNIIKGGNSVTISGGKLTLSGGEDAIKSDEEVKQGKGYILISEDAVLDITCSDDALQAAQAVTVEATARLTVFCGGDLVNCPGTVNVADSAVTMKP